MHGAEGQPSPKAPVDDAEGSGKVEGYAVCSMQCKKLQAEGPDRSERASGLRDTGKSKQFAVNCKQ